MHMAGSVFVSGFISGPYWAIWGHGGSVRSHFPYFLDFLWSTLAPYDFPIGPLKALLLALFIRCGIMRPLVCIFIRCGIERAGLGADSVVHQSRPGQAILRGM